MDVGTYKVRGAVIPGDDTFPTLFRISYFLAILVQMSISLCYIEISISKHSCVNSKSSSYRFEVRTLVSEGCFLPRNS